MHMLLIQYCTPFLHGRPDVCYERTVSFVSELEAAGFFELCYINNIYPEEICLMVHCLEESVASKVLAHLKVKRKRY